MADIKSHDGSLKPAKQEYRAPTLRTYGNIETITQASKDFGKIDSNPGKGKTGGVP